MTMERGVMAKGVFITYLVVASCGPGLKVTKDTNDKTAPSVVIKVKGANGQYAAATTVQLGVGERLDLMCIVTDNGGVSRLDLTFSHGTDHCTTHEGAVYSGSFTIEPIPNDLSQTLQGDSAGQVLSELPMLATLQGPFSCNIPPSTKGTPYGATITVTCVGKNWSSHAADSTTTEKLTVNLH